AEYVRTLRHGEPIKDLIEERKARAWVDNAEYAIVQLATGERVLVRGGPAGITFSVNPMETQVYMTRKGSPVPIKRIYFHTHPRVTGPSENDLRVLEMLGQTRSYIFEIGGDPRGTLIRPK